jgi:hypothetical protein
MNIVVCNRHAPWPRSAYADGSSRSEHRFSRCVTQLCHSVEGCHLYSNSIGTGSRRRESCFLHPRSFSLCADLASPVSSAAKCTPNAPCTNRPIKCPQATCGLVIWSYSMEAHYADRHTSEPMPASLARQCRLRYHERDYLRRTLNDRYVARPKSLCVKDAQGQVCCPCSESDAELFA